jgi:hypothetical protein
MAARLLGGIPGRRPAGSERERRGPRGTISVFNGPPPTIQTFESAEEEVAAVAAWLAKRKAEGVAGCGITCS